MQQHFRQLRAAAYVFASLFALSAAADPIQVRILGTAVNLDPAPQVSEGLLEGSPAVFVGHLGCRFMSEADGRMLIISPSGSQILATPGADYLEVDGEQQSLPARVRLVDGHVVCALRPVLEAQPAA